ncbi:response regulator [Aliarcobacter butzleri]|uniref:response regulator n=1 Tax=Aliarcobacter butzleri TaxID=28197 RepID=UPI001260A8EF|nr:response regulator [Aliarcobacter butzleri]
MQKEKILIVENESIVALEIKRTLEHFNFEVTDIAFDYKSAISSALSNKPDLILVDINLGKGKDGIEVVKKIQTFYDVPIIYLTAFCEDKIINKAIKTKPVSYLIKPFKREELKSNIIIALNKISQENNIIKIGDEYHFSTKEDRLYFKAININLGLKEKLLLKKLLELRGQVVEFKELEELIWETNDISKSTLRTLIYRLRAKFNGKFIETIPNIGCKIEV